MNKGIFLLSAFLLSGCGGSDGGESGGGDYDTGSNNEQVLTSDAVVISEDEYFGLKFNLSRDAQIKTSIEIIDGPAIEAFLVTEAEYNTWVTITQNSQFTSATLNYFKDLSISPVATAHDSGWWRIDSGTYYYILENTNYGTTKPPFNFINDKVTVAYSISVK